VPPQRYVYIHNCFIGGGFAAATTTINVRQASDGSRKTVDRPVKASGAPEEKRRATATIARCAMARISQVGLGSDGMPVAWTTVIGIDQNPPQAHAQTVRGLTRFPYSIPNQRFDYHLRQNAPFLPAFGHRVGRSQNEFTWKLHG